MTVISEDGLDQERTCSKEEHFILVDSIHDDVTEQDIVLLEHGIAFLWPHGRIHEGMGLNEL